VGSALVPSPCPVGLPRTHSAGGGDARVNACSAVRAVGGNEGCVPNPTIQTCIRILMSSVGLATEMPMAPAVPPASMRCRYVGVLSSSSPELQGRPGRGTTVEQGQRNACECRDHHGELAVALGTVA
jgi:hypothetical protein